MLARGGAFVHDASQDRGQLDDGIHGDDFGEPGVLLRYEPDEPSLLAPSNVLVGQIGRNEAKHLWVREPGLPAGTPDNRLEYDRATTVAWADG